YNLIGGASRERVRIYANGWSRGTTIDERVERGLAVKAMGFTAAKFDPFPGPWRNFVDRRDEDFAIEYVRAMRQALGPDFELLIEAHRRFAPAHAIRIGHRLAELGIDWYEEPCLSENIELVAEVRRSVPIPIVTGEPRVGHRHRCRKIAGAPAPGGNASRFPPILGRIPPQGLHAEPALTAWTAETRRRLHSMTILGGVRRGASAPETFSQIRAAIRRKTSACGLSGDRKSVVEGKRVVLRILMTIGTSTRKFDAEPLGVLAGPTGA